VYLLLLVVAVLLALIAVAWAPIFAVIIAVPLFLGFLVYVGMRPRADETIKPPQGPSKTVESDNPKGIWGEPRR
jgi:hypothetical protein